MAPKLLNNVKNRVSRAVRERLREGTVRRTVEQCQKSVERAAVRSPLGSGLYMALTGRIGHEAQSVLAGQLMHYKVLSGTDDGARYTLRRNTHRIEKGLIMRPRRGVFALGYIAETMAALEQVVERTPAGKRDPLLRWSCDVLRLYFESCDDHPDLRGARQRFAQFDVGIVEQEPTHTPYERIESEDLPSLEQLQALARRRRSVRWFEQRPVPRPLLDKALAVALQAPSACNRQPFRFVVLDEPNLVQRVGKIPMGTSGFLHNIPVLIVLVGQFRAFQHERDRHLIYLDGGLALMGLEYALEVQGLSSCSLNWPAIPQKESAIRKAINLAQDESPVMLLAVGYADASGGIPYSQKKPLEEARRYNL